MNRKLSNYIYIILGIAALGLLLTGCGKEKVENEASLRTVRTVVLTEGSGLYQRSFSGRLHSVQETNLSFKVAGSIENIFVQVGDSFRQGDILATLDKTPYELEAKRSKASLTQAQADLRNLEANYQRTRKLYEGGNASRSDLDDARASAESAEASVESSQKALEIAQLDLSYCDLIAASNCSIAVVDAEEGENIVSGQTVFQATCGDDLEVRLDIPESVITSLQRGMDGTVTIPALNNQSFQAQVSEVGVSATQGGTTFPVTLLITDSNAARLRAGLSADVSFTLSRSEGAGSVLIVPLFAISEDQKGRFAYVVETSNGTTRVRRQSVEVGGIQNDGVEVLNGLEPGMRVAVAGVSVLRDGMEVKASNE